MGIREVWGSVQVEVVLEDRSEKSACGLECSNGTVALMTGENN